MAQRWLEQAHRAERNAAALLASDLQTDVADH